MYSPSGHPRSKWVFFFIWTVLEKFSTLILMAPIHWRGSTGEQVMSCYISVPMKKQTHLLLGKPEHFQPVFIFRWTIRLSKHSQFILFIVTISVIHPKKGFEPPQGIWIKIKHLHYPNRKRHDPRPDPDVWWWGLPSAVETEERMRTN